MIEYSWLIPIIPTVAFLLIIFVTRPLKLLSAITAVAAMGTSFIISIGVALEVMEKGISMEHPVELTTTWLSVGAMKLEAGILIDPLTAVMLLVVTFVALLVQIYSIGYMHGEKGYSTFFAYLSLFCTSMLGLVLANNYFEIFFFWELVGLCSYLLIGFYLERNSAVQANKKAFITNRIGDFGFMLGIFILYLMFGTFNFRELAEVIPYHSGFAMLTLAGVLIFTGPMAKSAQFPLHVWLPDAMEGPTPVSALIHAATMVAAGVYLVARGYVLFASSETTSLMVAYIGGFTALFAASIALVQEDCKRILAFSTMSQLGYMIMAMGVGSLTAGMFHLTTHAFFKALMFLGAGSVIHAMHEQNIFKMGGLAKEMKVTAWTFIIGALALAGIFPFSGFWSKDEILLSTFDNGYTGLYVLGSLVAFMTAFYMFRMIFITFFGEKRTSHHAHESSPVMTIPLILLAILAVISGFIGAPFVREGFSSFVYFGEAHHAKANLVIMAVSTILALAGIGLAWLIYGRRTIMEEPLAQKAPALYRVLYNKFYIDEAYQWFFSRVVLGLSHAFNWNERHVVDAFFDGLGNLVRYAGGKLRFTQTGNLQTYALVFFIAVLIIALWVAAPVMGGVMQ